MKTRALIFLFLILSVVVWAQPGDPGPDPDVPLTGIEWLILAGGALGIKRFLDNRKKK